MSYTSANAIAVGAGMTQLRSDRAENSAIALSRRARFLNALCDRLAGLRRKPGDLNCDLLRAQTAIDRFRHGGGFDS